MTRLKKFFVSALAMMPVLSLSITPVLAAAENGNNRAERVASVSELRKRSQEKLEERVANDKSRLGNRLSAADETRIKGKCKAAQNLISAYSKKVDNFETSRQGVYTKITDRLTTLSQKLETAGRTDDVASIQTHKDALQAKIDEVYAAIDDFQVALSDMSEIDCTADPTAFQAVLESARSYRATVNEKTKAVREYYAQTLVKALAVIKNNLATSKPDTSGEEAE